MPVLYVTSNENKFNEAKFILGDRIKHCALELQEIQSMDVSVVAQEKAIKAFDYMKEPVIVEDIALYIDSLKGFPGPFVKWVQDTIGYDELPAIAKGDKSAIWAVSMVYYDGKHVFGLKKEAKGKLVFSRGKSWGFESIFQPDGFDKTVAEMTYTEKNEFSPRFHALKALKSTIIWPA